MSIKVVDLNEEATEIKDEPPTIEEATEQAPKEEPTNEIIDEPTEEAKQEPPKEEVKTITKKKASDIVECNKCNKWLAVWRTALFKLRGQKKKNREEGFFLSSNFCNPSLQFFGLVLLVTS